MTQSLFLSKSEYSLWISQYIRIYHVILISFAHYTLRNPQYSEQYSDAFLQYILWICLDIFSAFSVIFPVYCVYIFWYSWVVLLIILMYFSWFCRYCGWYTDVFHVYMGHLLSIISGMQLNILNIPCVTPKIYSKIPEVYLEKISSDIHRISSFAGPSFPWTSSMLHPDKSDSQDRHSI